MTPTQKEMNSCSRVERLSTYNEVSGYLSHLIDEELSALLEEGTTLSLGTGGEVRLLVVQGKKVVAKMIPFSEIESKSPETTANLFGLPAYYQYGIGSTGFGTRREVSAHQLTTDWVRQGGLNSFPLMYHYRILPRSTPSVAPTPDELDKLEKYVEYWNGSSAIRKRMEAIQDAPTHAVVFMEYFPQKLDNWFREKLVEGGSSTESAVRMVDRELKTAVIFMKQQGFLHFDAHFHNILTDGYHLYFTDFGLAISHAFELSPEERSFFEKHRDYDRYYVITRLFQAVLIANLEIEKHEAFFEGRILPEDLLSKLPPPVAAIIKPYLPIAVLMQRFFQGLRKNKKTPYPGAELALEWEKLGNWPK